MIYTHTRKHIYRQPQATTAPEDHNWPQEKTEESKDGNSKSVMTFFQIAPFHVHIGDCLSPRHLVTKQINMPRCNAGWRRPQWTLWNGTSDCSNSLVYNQIYISKYRKSGAVSFDVRIYLCDAFLFTSFFSWKRHCHLCLLICYIHRQHTVIIYNTLRYLTCAKVTNAPHIKIYSMTNTHRTLIVSSGKITKWIALLPSHLTISEIICWTHNCGFDFLETHNITSYAI